eukprot:TRINITY_DN46369_c0_g1_i1.p1 TRINITY_DN46369_c0_g1~~TRINITY_DN46369_c0_g1_i1.p1  ORF type:complete len:200 (+),score=22.52 TRINITY_DN46369_c0_g1_i1:77-676(+)
MLRSLVGSEMCIRDSNTESLGRVLGEMVRGCVRPAQHAANVAVTVTETVHGSNCICTAWGETRELPGSVAKHLAQKSLDDVLSQEPAHQLPMPSGFQAFWVDMARHDQVRSHVVSKLETCGVCGLARHCYDPSLKYVYKYAFSGGSSLWSTELPDLVSVDGVVRARISQVDVSKKGGEIQFWIPLCESTPFNLVLSMNS